MVFLWKPFNQSDGGSCCPCYHWRHLPMQEARRSYTCKPSWLVNKQNRITGTFLNLWCPAPQHVELVLHGHHAVAGQRHRERRCAAPRALLHAILLHAVCHQVPTFDFHLPTYYIEIVMDSAQGVEFTVLGGAQAVPDLVSSLVVPVGTSKAVNALVGWGPRACSETLPPSLSAFSQPRV